MGAERFRVSAGMEAVHVPVKSGPEALTEILSGRADCEGHRGVVFLYAT
jgi:tripartite-type tricarboxylate transporter receptor subunit TctC